jgi:hypothetical protein
MSDDGNVWAKRLLYVVSFVVAFFVVKALTQSWFDKRSEKRMAAASEQKLAVIREEATKRHPDLPGACKAVAENAMALAEEIRFSKSLPAVHKALMSAP